MGKIKNHVSVFKEFNAVVRCARGAIFWERLWPKIVPSICFGGLYLSMVCSGMLTAASPQMRMVAALSMAGMALCAPFFVKTGNLWVTRADGVRRIDENTADPHRPAQMLSDRVYNHEDSDAQAIWDLHTKRLWDEWKGKFKAGTPRPGMAARDKFGLRYIVAVCTVLSGIFAGDKIPAHFAASLDWRIPEPPLVFRAWVQMPDGVDLPVIRLDERSTEKTMDGNDLLVHEGSRMTLHVFGKDVLVFINGKEIGVSKVISPPQAVNVQSKRSKSVSVNDIIYVYEIAFDEQADSYALITVGNRAVWHFKIRPDEPPQIQLLDVAIDASDPSKLDVRFKNKDDYGLGVLEMHLEAAVPAGVNPLPSAVLPPISLSP